MKKHLAIYLIFFSLLAAHSYGPMPGAKKPNLDMFVKPQSNKEAIEGFLSKIPEKYSVAATNNLGSHISHRQQVFTIPVGIEKADFILFLLNDNFAQPSLDAQKEMVNNLRLDDNYIEALKIGDFVAFKKRTILL